MEAALFCHPASMQKWGFWEGRNYFSPSNLCKINGVIFRDFVLILHFGRSNSSFSFALIKTTDVILVLQIFVWSSASLSLSISFKNCIYNSSIFSTWNQKTDIIWVLILENTILLSVPLWNRKLTLVESFTPLQGFLLFLTISFKCYIS